MQSAGQNSYSTSQQTCLCYAMLQTTETLLGLLANLVGFLNKILRTWLHCGSPESEIGIVISCTLGATEYAFREGTNGLNRLNRVWVHPVPYSMTTMVSSRVQSGRYMTLTTRLPLLTNKWSNISPPLIRRLGLRMENFTLEVQCIYRNV